jgi:hypothetical protein
MSKGIIGHIIFEGHVMTAVNDKATLIGFSDNIRLDQGTLTIVTHVKVKRIPTEASTLTHILQ